MLFSSQEGKGGRKTEPLSQRLTIFLFFSFCRNITSKPKLQPINQIIVGGSAAKSD